MTNLLRPPPLGKNTQMFPNKANPIIQQSVCLHGTLFSLLTFIYFFCMCARISSTHTCLLFVRTTSEALILLFSPSAAYIRRFHAHTINTCNVNADERAACCVRPFPLLHSREIPSQETGGGSLNAAHERFCACCHSLFIVRVCFLCLSDRRTLRESKFECGDDAAFVARPAWRAQ